ncbi:hypothetical protein ACQB60_39995 [Actinomycetota bacterium Odt1-20B]
MAHAAPTAPASSGPLSRTSGLALAAVLLGAVYGIWASGIHRDAGPITGMNVLFGFVTGIAFAAIWYGLRAVSPRLPRELRAVSWTVFTGLSFGFLYSLTGATVLRSTIMALAVAVPVGLALFYRYYTTE